MAESGSGDSYPEIIVKRSLRSRLRILVEWVITVFCWGLYVYLLLPIVTLLLWALGIKTIHYYIWGDKGFSELIKLLKNGGIITVFILFLLLSWTFYNLMLVRIKKERRHSRCQITGEDELANSFNLTIQELEGLKSAQVIKVKLENGKPLFINE